MEEMNMRRLALAAAIPLLLGVVLVGCIVGDELTTFSIRPDGSADLVLFRSNVRSTEAGAKADEEQKSYVERFDAGQDPDHVRIREAGGEIVAAHWLRREHPCANVVTARFPDPSALEKYLTITGKDDELRLEAHFSKEATRRRLSFVLRPGRDFKLSEPATVKESRQKQADGVSETRFAVTEGRIVATRGFTVAADGRSALLALDEIQKLLLADPQRVELFLEWEVPAH
jgi:hypothetical protein